MASHFVSRVFVGVFLLAQGCFVLAQGCSPAPGPVGGQLLPSLAFDGLPQTVSCASDDAEPKTPGFQLAVEVALSNGDDSGFTTVSVTNSREDIDAGEGTLDEARATIIIEVVPDAEAPGAENTLTAGATSTNGETITASETVRVICADDPSPPASCVFTQPIAGTAALTASPAAIEVTCSGGDPASAEQQALLTSGVVVVTANPGNGEPPESVEIDLVGGTGTGLLELPADSTATLELLLVDPGNVFGGPVVDSVAVTIDLGFAVEEIVVVAAADGVFNIEDNNGVESSDPLTSDVNVTFERDVSGGSFTGTTALGTCATAPGVAVAGATITLVDCVLPQGVAGIEIAGQDATGSPVLPADATLSINVDTIRPAITFSTPANAAVLTSDDDVGLAGSFAASVTLASEDNGAAVRLLVLIGEEVASVSNAVVTDDSVTATVPLGQGERTLTAEITDAAGNTGADASITVTVDSEGPALVLVAEDVDAADDIGGDLTDGIQVDVTVTPTGLTAGRTITISSADAVIGTCLSQGDAVAVPCRVTYLAGQPYAVTATATDELGNTGTSNTVQVSP